MLRVSFLWFLTQTAMGRGGMGRGRGARWKAKGQRTRTPSARNDAQALERGQLIVQVPRKFVGV